MVKSRVIDGRAEGEKEMTGALARVAGTVELLISTSKATFEKCDSRKRDS